MPLQPEADRQINEKDWKKKTNQREGLEEKTSAIGVVLQLPLIGSQNT